MISKNNIDNKTDKAWMQLHDRLKKDGLLVEEKNKTRFTLITRWAVAALALLIISFTVFYTSQKMSDDKIQMLVLSNEENSGILVKTLHDGSIVYLTTQTSLQYPQNFQDEKREVFLQGDAYFDIQRSPDKPFFIETELARIEVLGTAFNVDCSVEKAFSLSVERGSVKVINKSTSQSYIVKGGETIDLSDNRLELSSTRNAYMFRKYKHRFHFRDERLEDVVKVVNINTENAILLELSPNISDRLITVAFEKESPEMIAQLICIALNLQQKQDNGKIIIYE